MRNVILVCALCLVTPTTGLAALTVPSFFSDRMVVQQQRPAKIWGKADPGAEVSVAFKGTASKAVADAQGRWATEIKTGSADAEGATLTITAGQETVTIKDVLVGEVWFASGQSNMVFTMDRVPAYADLIRSSNHPQIRMFNAPTVTAVEPQEDIEGEWAACTPQTVGRNSAVAFFFARKLHQELGVPIGVIKSAWGGKPVETFTSRKALRTLPGTKRLVENADAADKDYDPERAMKLHQQRLLQWKKSDEAWKQKSADARGRRPRRPASPKRPFDTEGQPGVLFNSMIHPFVGYTITGAIWYQGEGNAKPGAVPYDQTLPLLINDWRTRWQDDFSFYFVQLANFRAPSTEPGNNDPWPLLQDRMRRVLESTPKTGMAVINDVGEANDIHPKNKHDVGERLALWALAKDYGKDLVYSGPLYRESTPKTDSITVAFDSVGDGLKTRDGEELGRFEIAGKDQVWHWAKATITGKDTVSVRSDDVPHPIAVRFAWAANPEGANLVNSAGLPASVFRTDDWDDVEPDTAGAQAAQARLQQRRVLAQQIKTIREQRAALKRDTEEFKRLSVRQSQLMERLKKLVPARAENQ